MPKIQECGNFKEGICKDERWLDMKCPFISDNNWTICEYWTEPKKENKKNGD